MKEIFAICTQAGTYVWQLQAQTEGLERVQESLRLSFFSGSLKHEAHLATLAARLQDLGEKWIQPSADGTQEWIVDLDQLRTRFVGIGEQDWLVGSRTVLPQHDEIERDGRREGVVRFVLPMNVLPTRTSASTTAPSPLTGVDPMLGLYRREEFDRELPALCATALISSEPLSLVMVDIDKFKAVNDTHGHPIGDEVLKGVSAVLLRVVGDRGRCFRYGGEEMCVLLPNFCLGEAVALAERTRLEISRAPYTLNAIRVTASFGVAEVPAHTRDAKALLTLADEALYGAKRSGRDRVLAAGNQPVEANSSSGSGENKRAAPADSSKTSMLGDDSALTRFEAEVTRVFRLIAPLPEYHVMILSELSTGPQRCSYRSSEVKSLSDLKLVRYVGQVSETEGLFEATPEEPIREALKRRALARVKQHVLELDPAEREFLHLFVQEVPFGDAGYNSLNPLAHRVYVAGNKLLKGGVLKSFVSGSTSGQAVMSEIAIPAVESLVGKPLLRTSIALPLDSVAGTGASGGGSPRWTPKTGQ